MLINCISIKINATHTVSLSVLSGVNRITCAKVPGSQQVLPKCNYSPLAGHRPEALKFPAGVTGVLPGGALLRTYLRLFFSPLESKLPVTSGLSRRRKTPRPASVGGAGAEQGALMLLREGYKELFPFLDI